MTQAFDDRIVRVGLEIDGDISVFEGLDIRAQGRMFASPTNNICSVRISNLTEDQRNYILTKASPNFFREGGRQSVKMYLDVGRESTGVFRLFEGGVMATGATQPPDIGIVLESINNNYATSLIGGTSFGAITKLSTICKRIAQQNGLTLEFDAKDINIENYSFTGALAKQVEELQFVGGMNVFVDNKTLVVLDVRKRRGAGEIFLALDTGMVGQPNACDSGVIVKAMINSAYRLGGGIYVESKINPAVNGHYKIMQLNFEIANRDDPFWFTIYGSNNPAEQGEVVNG